MGSWCKWTTSSSSSSTNLAVATSSSSSSSSAAHRVVLLVVVVALLLMVQAVESHECQVEHCSRQYQHSVDSIGLHSQQHHHHNHNNNNHNHNQQHQHPPPAAATLQHRRYCVVLRTYLACIRLTARSCRGNLKYHTTSSLVEQWNHEFNCSYVVTPPTDEAPLVEVPATKTSRGRGGGGSRECAYNGRQEFRTCGLFGDPHLRTFTDEAQTCKVLGAWPLIDNAYIAVQVTNEAVLSGSKASATSKVTVIIKAHPPCAHEKTYEAVTDNLPNTFVDGTQSSGVERSVRIRDRDPGKHVEILVKYIATTIVVRQVGHYLTFAVRMPKEVANQGEHETGLQLCVKGCPATERIDHNQVLLNGAAGVGGSGGMSRDSAVALCRAINVTDFYFDSCVFDLMTTGDASFSKAANEAMLDGLVLNGNGPQNGRTGDNHHNNRTSGHFTSQTKTEWAIVANSGTQHRLCVSVWWTLSLTACTVLLLLVNR